MLFAGTPEIADNWTVGDHNANHQQIDHSPDTAAQLQRGQCLCADLPSHINIGHRHTEYSELAEHQGPGQAQQVASVLQERWP